MVDIHSAKAEIRRGEKKIENRRKKKPQDKNMMSPSAKQGGLNNNYYALDVLW